MWAVLQSGLTPILAMLAFVFGGLLIERAAPAEQHQPARHTALNIVYAMLTGCLRLPLAPLLGIVVVFFVNRLGGGWIALPAHGAMLLLSIAAYLLVVDFLEFAFHRAQHSVPFLWAMHSFHHSDPSVNVSTATRNFWLELPIKTLFVYPFAAILFRVPSAVLTVYAATTVWHAVNHLNIRWRFPVPWFVLNNPQFHRIHHSILPEHYNRNFSAYFPLWDLLFRTAYVPKADEYPATGLDHDQAPITLADAFFWPWRHRLRAESTAAGNATN